MKSLLMLGGGFLQTYVIKRAKELGYYVHVLDGDPDAMGFSLADEYAAINIVDEEKCLAYAKVRGIDGVLTAATDFGVLAMSRIACELNLPGINYESAKMVKNKALVRKCLYDAKADDTGYSFEISSFDEISALLSKVVFPVMVKPCDGSGSRGASRVDRAEEFVEACYYAMAGSITHRAVAEPFVTGREYGVEIFVEQGEIHILAIMQKVMTEPPYYAELGHAIPSGLTFEMEQKVTKCVKRAIKALNINHGSVNMDLLIGDKGDVHIVDIGARMGGNLIGSHIVPAGTGIDYMGNMVKAALGDKTDWSPDYLPHPVATRLLALTPGEVKSLPDLKELADSFGVTIEHHMKIGDIINEYHTNLDGCGYVLAIENDVESAKKKAAAVKEYIDKAIIRA